MIQKKILPCKNQRLALNAVAAISLAMPSCLTLAAHPASGSMCANTDKVVFSCALGNGKKLVSLCAVNNVSQGQSSFYYAYGRPSSPELVYPAKGQPGKDAFAQAHLVYGGASGGTAYSFVNGGYKYIVYSISGTGFNDGGVLVQRPGQTDALRDMKCQHGKITESDDDRIINATKQWPSDTDLETHGLPSVH